MHPQIDAARCTACGLCASDCIYDAIRVREDAAEAVPGSRCSECGHCVAICPTGAVSLPHLGEAPRIGERPTPAQLAALMKGRRSTRWFRDEPLPRETIDELLETAAHAPSGCNARPVSVTVVVDPFVRRQIEDQVQRLAKPAARLLAAPGLLTALKHAPFLEARRMADPDLVSSMQMLKSNKTLTRPWVTMNAPALLLFHADPTRPTPGEDCVIAADHVSLLAEAMGLGSCWNGVLADFCGRLPHLRRRLGLPAGDRVFAALSLGRPALRFTHEAPRRALPVHYV